MTTRKRRNDPTRMVTAGVSEKEPRQHLACLGCGDTLYVETPMLVSIFVAMTKAFVAAHRHCKDPTPVT